MKYKNPYSKKVFKLIKNLRISQLFQGLIHEINLIPPGSLKNLENLSTVAYFVLNNNFFHTQLAFAVVL